jgi:riboflavin biosynthesis pyrimidine reductase
MVGVTGDAVRAEGSHHIRRLLVEDGGDALDELLEGSLVDRPVRVAEPLVPIRDAAVGAPGLVTLGSTDRPEGSRSCREAWADIAGLAVRHVDQDVAEVRVFGM